MIEKFDYQGSRRNPTGARPFSCDYNACSEGSEGLDEELLDSAAPMTVEMPEKVIGTAPGVEVHK